MEIVAGVDSCKFVHTGRSGGRKGAVCKRPEREHCPNGFECSETHPYKDRRVHHPFHRDSKVFRSMKQFEEAYLPSVVANSDAYKKLEERLKKIHRAFEEVADDIDTYGAKDATKLRAAWKAANED